jgi:hypothetical protein
MRLVTQSMPPHSICRFSIAHGKEPVRLCPSHSIIRLSAEMSGGEFPQRRLGLVPAWSKEQKTALATGPAVIPSEGGQPLSVRAKLCSVWDRYRIEGAAVKPIPRPRSQSPSPIVHRHDTPAPGAGGRMGSSGDSERYGHSAEGSSKVRISPECPRRQIVILPVRAQGASIIPRLATSGSPSSSPSSLYSSAVSAI